MSNGKNDEAFARLFKLQATVGKLVLDGKRSAEEVCSVLQVVVAGQSPGYSMRDFILACHFDQVSHDIEKHFTLEAARSGDRKVFHFDRSLSSEDAVKAMDKEGYSPANLVELLVYAKDGWKGKEDRVVALGSSAQILGDRYVPYLGRDGAERYIHISRWCGGWSGKCRFLAARN